MIDYRFKVQKKGDEAQESITSRTERVKQLLKQEADATKKKKEDVKNELKRNIAELETSQRVKKPNNSAVADITEGQQGMVTPSTGAETGGDEENEGGEFAHYYDDR